jgi:hypothetical protein
VFESGDADYKICIVRIFEEGVECFELEWLATELNPDFENFPEGGSHFLLLMEQEYNCENISNQEECGQYDDCYLNNDGECQSYACEGMLLNDISPDWCLTHVEETDCNADPGCVFEEDACVYDMADPGEIGLTSDFESLVDGDWEMLSFRQYNGPQCDTGGGQYSYMDMAADSMGLFLSINFEKDGTVIATQSGFEQDEQGMALKEAEWFFNSAGDICTINLFTDTGIACVDYDIQGSIFSIVSTGEIGDQEEVTCMEIYLSSYTENIRYVSADAEIDDDIIKDGSPSNPFAVINTAIANTETGGTVLLGPGTYFQGLAVAGNEYAITIPLP